MSSQASSFPAIEFSVTTPFRHVRLMEVSDDVLEIIKSKGKNGTKPRLMFKSSPPPNDTTTLTGNYSATKSKDSVLHLCSDDKIWAIKQVSTSNSVYILQPSVNTITDIDTNTEHNNDSQNHNVDIDNNGDEDKDMNNEPPIPQAPKGAVSATAKVGNFLELQPIKIDEQEIKKMISQLLPVYDPPEITDANPLHQTELKDPVSVQTIENDIPAPVTIIRKLFSRLCMFEHPSNSGRYIPSSAALFHTWSKIVEGCSIESIKLDRGIDVDRIGGVLTEAVDRSIAESMLVQGGMFDELQLVEMDSSSSGMGDFTRNLKPLEMCLFVAILILKVKSQSSTSTRQMEVPGFIEEWSSLVPTSFVKYCTTENLTSRNLVSVLSAADADGDDSGMMTWSEELVASDFTLDRSSMGKTTTTGVKDVSVKSAATGKRKWHEKFAAQRAAKK